MIENISCRNNLLEIEIPPKLVNKSFSMSIRLKDNYLDDKAFFSKRVELNCDSFSFSVDRDAVYFECDIYDEEGNLIHQQADSFMVKIVNKIDMEGKSEINRQVVEIKSKDYRESDRIVIDKSEQEYFSKTESPNRIKQIFDRFIYSAYDYVYIQDPYFDFNSYKDLIENLPVNIEVKVLCKNKD